MVRGGSKRGLRVYFPLSPPYTLLFFKLSLSLSLPCWPSQREWEWCGAPPLRAPPLKGSRQHTAPLLLHTVLNQYWGSVSGTLLVHQHTLSLSLLWCDTLVNDNVCVRVSCVTINIRCIIPLMSLFLSTLQMTCAILMYHYTAENAETWHEAASKISPSSSFPGCQSTAWYIKRTATTTRISSSNNRENIVIWSVCKLGLHRFVFYILMFQMF